jgi:hypothetical protein
MPITVLDPTTESKAALIPLAPRLPSLEGRRIGVLDNRKANADRVFDLVEDILRARFATEVVVRRQKPDFSRAAPQPLLEDLRACAAVITGVGD